MSAYGIEWQSNDLSQWVDNDNAQWDGLALTSRFKAKIGIVDATLTDFPVMLNISEASGVGANDLTRFFDELAWPGVDGFAGTNGDEVVASSDIWELLSGDSNTITFQGNTAYFNYAQGSGAIITILESSFTFEGDFDVQVDFTLDSFTAPSSNIHWLPLLRMFNASDTMIGQIGRAKDSSHDEYYYNGEDVASAYGGSADASGKLRIKRVSGVVTVYYWSGAQWEWDGDTDGQDVANSNTDTLNVILYFEQESTGSAYGSIDNFVINSGTVVWPEGTHPNRKKIAVTTSDGQTQCPVEIEHFDILNEVAVLHTKVPSVSASENTILYVHYSADQINNTAYVGDTGDAAAQDVWDSDFIAVYHMAQDPDGDGAGSILDSTENGNDGTPSGSMTTADLVAGQVTGTKAIDFDGSNDFIGLPSGAYLKSYTEVSVEVTARINEALSGNAPLFYHSTNTTGYGRVSIWPATTGEARGYVRDSETGSAFLATGSALPSPTAWHAHALVLDSDTNSLKLYVDGAEDADNTTSKGALTATDPADAVQISAFAVGGSPEYAEAEISEVRLSQIARSASWIKATYNSLFDTLVTYQADWMANWENRAVFTIDADLVDSDLTNFPIALPISSSCGIGTDDMTAIFDGLAYSLGTPSFTGDTFTGDDGDPPDPDLWEDIVGGPTINSNKLRLTTATANDETGSLFRIQGDFDIQVDLDLVTYPNTNYWNFSFRLWNEAEDAGVSLEQRVESSQRMFKFFEHTTGWSQVDSDNTSLTSTKFRFVRSGSTITAYYDDSGWTSMGTSTELGTDDIKIRLKCAKWSSNPTAVADFDNFLINSGTVIWPYELRDTFTGDDGDPPDPDLWDFISETNSGDLSIQSNKLNFDPNSAGTLRISKLKSLFNLSGDFDIQVDFDYSSLTTPTSGVTYACNFQVYTTSGTNIAYITRAKDDTPDDGYTSGGNSLGYSLIEPFVHTSGKLRITRAGSTVKVYHRNTGDTQWEWDGNTSGRSVGSSSSDLEVRFWFEQETGSTVLSNVDNFTINSGTVVWPEGTHPNRKKIAVTTSDGVTECYAEIEFFDIANEMALLHAKVPLISSSIDTEFFLYYDNTHFNNTDRIGDTGDTPAQLVWDSDFEAVYHLAQDPSGGADAVLDSTDNGNDGTSMGSMTSADLVAGQVSGAKAIDFDGSNDGIGCGNIGGGSGYVDLTVEAVAKSLDSGYSNSKYLVSKDASGDNTGDGSLVIQSSSEKYIWNHQSASGNVTGSVVPYNNWYHIAYVHDSTATELFENGESADTDTTAYGTMWNNATALQIGTVLTGSATYSFQGLISEVRISSTPRSAAWLKATYNTLFDTFGTWSVEGVVDVYVEAGTPAQIVWSVHAVDFDVTIEAGTPAQITWSPQASTVSVSVPAGTPAQIAWSVLSAGINVAVLASTPSIAWSALSATITQNLNAIGIVSKPTVSASKPTVTATGRQPLASATSAKPSITVTVKAPFAEATLAGPSITVTSKGD